MKIGAVYPQIELGGDPDGLDRLGRAIEKLGYHHLLMFDHVVGAVHENRHPPLYERGPYTDKDPFHDPFVAFGYLAGITNRIELVTGVLILPQRQTVLVAKQAADLDLLSRERLVLGVGIGWNYVEYDALGQDFSRRGERLTEQIAYLRRLWSEPLLTFQGVFDRIDRASILPRPKRSIPIICGGISDAAYKRASRLADGFVFASDAGLPDLSKLRDHLRAAERSEEGFSLWCVMQDGMARGLDRDILIASADRCRNLGVTHISVCSMRRGLSSIEAHIDYFAEAAHHLGLK